VAISCFISLWIIILASSSWVIYSNPVRIKVLHMLWARWSSFYKQLFYNSLSHICVGLKTASAMTLIVVIVTEVFVGSSYGIGQQIYDAYIVYDCVSLFARVLITWVLGYGINVALSQFEKSIIHWRN
jgi:ABC-type nitrate/sulfonate/bicarbonate transport system permease component